MTLILRYAASPGIEALPEVALARWRIVRLPDGGCHLVGFRTDTDRPKGRFSTRLEGFDPVGMAGVTSSGRVYRLVGPSGDGPDTQLVRDGWLVTCGLRPDEATDVTPADAARPLN